MPHRNAPVWYFQPSTLLAGKFNCDCDSQLMFFFFYLFDVATVGVKLKPSDLNVLISSWLGFSGFGGVLVLQTRVPNVLGL